VSPPLSLFVFWIFLFVWLGFFFNVDHLAPLYLVSF
jgi:hypothetical protein